MQPELFAQHDSRTLLVDADIAHGKQLVEQPFSMHDLTSRLAAFSLRARPTC
jgi:hypothetical protein